MVVTWADLLTMPLMTFGTTTRGPHLYPLMLPLVCALLVFAMLSSRAGPTAPRLRAVLALGPRGWLPALAILLTSGIGP